jgi:NAD-dependent deacetylase
MFNISPYGNIVILTGAGISEESGLATFRDPQGIWSRYNLEEVCTAKAMKLHPDKVYQFYNEYRNELLDPKIQPNAAHMALGELEKQWQGNVTLITQNVDNLHERGGSKNVLHMHGELLRAKCEKCFNRFNVTKCDIETPCNLCKKTGSLRPDVVFFDEDIYFEQQITEALNKADLFIAIGTSGKVAPAGYFVTKALYRNAPTVVIDPKKPANMIYFKHHLQGKATEKVPEFVNNLLQPKP